MKTYKLLYSLFSLFTFILNAQTILIEDEEKSYSKLYYANCSTFDLSDSKSELSPKLVNYTCIKNVDLGKFNLIAYSGYSLSFNKTCIQSNSQATYKFTNKPIYECEVECKNTCPSGQKLNDNCECIPDCLVDEEYISSTNQCCPKLNQDFIHLESTMDECVITNPDVIAPDGSSWFVDNIYYSECNDDCIVEKRECPRGEIISNTECISPPEPGENFCSVGKIEKRFTDCKTALCVSKIVGSSSDTPITNEFDGECYIGYYCYNDKNEIIDEHKEIVSCGKLGEEDPIFKIETTKEELNTTTKKDDLIPELEPLELNSESINDDDDKDYNITKNTDTNISSVSKVHDTKLESYDFNKDGDNNISTNGEPINKDSTSDKVNKKSDNDKEYDSHETSDSAGSSENAEDGLMGKLESLLDFFSNPSGKIENAMNSIIKSDLVNRRYNFSKTCPIIKTVQIRLFNRDIVFMSQSFLDRYVYVDLFKSFIILIFVITAFKHAMRNN